VFLFSTPWIVQAVAELNHRRLWYTVIFERLHILGFILLGLFFIMYEPVLVKFVVPFAKRKKEVAIALFFSLSFCVQYYYWRYLYVTGSTNQQFSFLCLSFAYVSYGVALLFIFFGSSYIERLVKKYYLTLLSIILFIFIYYRIKHLFDSNWLFFSNSVNVLATSVLSLFYSTSMSNIDSAPILQVNNFVVEISRDCSGIESSLLFIFLFAIVLLFDDSIQKNMKTFLLVSAGIFGAFIVTAIRIIILSIIGVEISETFATTSFHANVGWVLFVLYVFGFYALLRKISPK